MKNSVQVQSFSGELLRTVQVHYMVITKRERLETYDIIGFLI